MDINLKNQKGVAFIPILLWSAILLISGLVGQDAVRRGYISINIPLRNINTAPSQTPSFIPVQTSEPTPTSRPAQAPIVQKILPTPDPDPIINCSFTDLGVKQIKRSECSKSFECQIGGNWQIYTSHEKCTQDQKAENDKTYREVYDATYKALNNQSGATYTPSAYTPPPTTSLNNTLIDCTIDGKVVGNMTYAECSQKITEYYQAKTVPVQDTTAQDYNNAVSACLNRMRALGAASSSQAQACYTNPNLGL